ncbi:MAG: LON peptidase substrate-binding domain-containing protein [Armatimonadetes bacterium]|nr:LON peptidase substrate-binding domain-containing protein [Armatimonadota bacterium]
MGDRLEEMALFPLNTVLFPYAQLQIHVFEDRYRELIRHCTQNDQPFGVVLIRSGEEVGGHVEPYMVGTVVRIVSIHTFEDGKMDVRVQGERRFRVRKFDESRSYMVGMVEPVIELEIEDTPKAEALVLRSREYVQAYIENYFARFDVKVAKIKLPSDPTALSFVVANFLQIENLEKQKLLETTDTLERLGEMIPILEQHMVEAKAPDYHKVTRQHMEEWIHPN